MILSPAAQAAREAFMQTDYPGWGAVVDAVRAADRQQPTRFESWAGSLPDFKPAPDSDRDALREQMTDAIQNMRRNHVGIVGIYLDSGEVADAVMAVVTPALQKRDEMVAGYVEAKDYWRERAATRAAERDGARTDYANLAEEYNEISMALTAMETGRDAALAAIARCLALEPFVITGTGQVVVRVSDIRATLAGPALPETTGGQQ